jgi:hypothetical protein
MPSNATPGEWKALLAPMLATAEAAEDVRGYLVITMNAGGQIEMRTNMPDPVVRQLMLTVIPEADGG